MLQQAYSDFHAKNYKLGKLPYVPNDKTLKLSNYTTAALKPAPYQCDQFSKLSNLGFMLNNQIGDCVCAAAGHAIQLMTSDSGTQVILPDSVIEQEYSLLSGYVPGNPATDVGTSIFGLVQSWQSAGFGGHSLGASLGLNFRVGLELTNSIYYFGFAMAGFGLPSSAEGETIWTVPPGGATGNGQFGSWGGHAVPLVGYDSHYIYFISWGAIYRMTWEFYYTYCDEAWALLSTDWINTKGVSLEGFDYAALAADLACPTV